MTTPRFRTLTLLLLAASFLASPVLADQWWDGFAPEGISASPFNATVTNAKVRDGALYLSGDFRTIGDTPALNLARWDGTGWSAVADEPPFQEPYWVEFYDGQVVSNGIKSSWIPVGPWTWNGTAWEVLGEGLDGGYFGLVVASEIYENDLYVMGEFTSTGNGVLAPGLARWDGTEWAPVGDAEALTFTGDMIVFEGELYAAGGISLDGVPEADGLARWNGASWSAVSALDPQTLQPQAGLAMQPGNGAPSVRALEIHDGKLAIAGEFELVGDMPVANVVFYDPTGPEPVWEAPASGSSPGLITSLASVGGQLYAGGATGMVPGATGPGTLGVVGSTGWTEVPDGPDDIVVTLVRHGGVLYVGGEFERAGGIAARSWVGYDGSGFFACHNRGGRGLSGNAAGLAPWQGGLLAFGSFANAGSQESRGLALWDGFDWTAMSGVEPGGEIRAVWVEGAELHVAGSFESVDGVSAPGLARFDGTQWHAYPAPTAYTLDLRDIGAVAAWNGKFYVAASSRRVSDQSIEEGLFEFDGTSWTLAYPDFRINDLEVYDGELYLAGSNSSGAPWTSLVRYDGATFTNVEDPSYPVALDDEIHGLRVIDGLLYVGVRGYWSEVVTWDGTNLASYGPSDVELLPGTSGIGVAEVHDIAIVDGTAFLVGQGEYNGFTVWSWNGTDSVWKIVDRGTDGRVHSAVGFGSDLYVGGDFVLAGMSRSLHRIGGDPVASSGIARYMTGAVTAAPPRSALALDQNQPNPFNPRTTIRFEIPAGGRDTELVVYDLRGRVVRTLVDGFRPAGPDAVVWDGTDDAGRAVASGSYLYLLRAGELTQARKMSLVR